MTETERLERIQTVTKFFLYWQGLRQVPVGLMLIVYAVLGQWNSDGLAAAMLRMFAMIGVAGLTWWAYNALGRWYSSNFGSVINASVTKPVDRISYWVLAPASGLATLVDLFGLLPFSALSLVFALAILWVHHVTGGGRPYYVWVAVLLVALAFVPMLFGVQEMIVYAFCVLGVVYILVGFLDHLQLTRIFKPLAKERGVS